MQSFLVAALLVVGALWLVKSFAKASPAQVPGFSRKLAGGACLAFAGFLAMRGSIQAATALFVFGIGLFGLGALPGGFPWTNKTPGQRSRVATSCLAMELDHDSGRMDGEVLRGPAKGKRLSVLDQAELKSFHALCATAGDQSQALLEAWLDRAQPEWRQAWGHGERGARPQASGAMSREEAYAVLGLKPGAAEADIRAAHRRLMKDFHPDHGGSDYLAAKINQAKDLLLG